MMLLCVIVFEAILKNLQNPLVLFGRLSMVF